MNNTANKYGLIRRSSETAEINMVMTGTDRSQLHVWALRNTGNDETTIFEMDSGVILSRYTDQGTADRYPRVEHLTSRSEYIDESIKSLFSCG